MIWKVYDCMYIPILILGYSCRSVDIRSEVRYSSCHVIAPMGLATTCPGNDVENAFNSKTATSSPRARSVVSLKPHYK